MRTPEEAEAAPAFSKRTQQVLVKVFEVTVGAILAFTTTGVIIYIDGKNPWAAFGGIAYGAFGTPFLFALTLVQMTPILLTGLGALVIFAAQIWNIGQEGQLYVGALFATWVALGLSTAPWFIVMPAALVASVVGGIVWSGIGGILYAYFGTDAIISAIMLNYIATFLVHYSVLGPPIGQPNSGGNAISLAVPLAAQLPIIYPGTDLDAGFVVAMAMPFVVYVILSRTTLGYSIRAMGFNKAAARYAGVKSRSTVLAVFALSGALSGLAGGVVLLGFQYRLQVGLSPGYGTMGIIAALLGGRDPIGTIFGALFTAALLNGTSVTTITQGLSSFLVNVLQGITIIVVVALSSEKIRLAEKLHLAKGRK
jgi:general nucleoside transport system permease protein